MRAEKAQLLTTPDPCIKVSSIQCNTKCCHVATNCRQSEAWKIMNIFPHVVVTSTAFNRSNQRQQFKFTPHSFECVTGSKMKGFGNWEACDSKKNHNSLSSLFSDVSFPHVYHNITTVSSTCDVDNKIL